MELNDEIETREQAIKELAKKIEHHEEIIKLCESCINSHKSILYDLKTKIDDGGV